MYLCLLAASLHAASCGRNFSGIAQRASTLMLPSNLLHDELTLIITQLRPIGGQPPLFLPPSDSLGLTLPPIRSLSPQAMQPYTTSHPAAILSHAGAWSSAQSGLSPRPAMGKLAPTPSPSVGSHVTPPTTPSRPFGSPSHILQGPSAHSLFSKPTTASAAARDLGSTSEPSPFFGQPEVVDSGHAALTQHRPSTPPNQTRPAALPVPPTPGRTGQAAFFTPSSRTPLVNISPLRRLDAQPPSQAAFARSASPVARPLPRPASRVEAPIVQRPASGVSPRTPSRPPTRALNPILVSASSPIGYMVEPPPVADVSLTALPHEFANPSTPFDLDRRHTSDFGHTGLADARCLDPSLVGGAATNASFSPSPTERLNNARLLPAFDAGSSGLSSSVDWATSAVTLNDTRAPTPADQETSYHGDAYPDLPTLQTEDGPLVRQLATPMWVGAYGDVAQQFLFPYGGPPVASVARAYEDGGDGSQGSEESIGSGSDSSRSVSTEDSGSWEAIGLLLSYKFIG
jgi:hypothetical protein